MKVIARCGTPSGWSKHKNHGEKPCDACYAAKAEYDRRRRSSGEQQVRSRALARAQNLARMELSRRHKAEYDHLYTEFKAATLSEAGLT